MRTLLAAVVALSCAAFGSAQMPSMEPGPEMKKLDWIIGDWVGEISMSAMGMDMSGTSTYKVSWHGQQMKIDSVQVLMGMEMPETSFTAWNPETKKYEYWGYSHMAPMPRHEVGELKDGKLVMVSDPWTVMGQTTVSRSTMWLDGEKLKFLLEFKEGDSWNKVGDGTFTRKSAR